MPRSRDEQRYNSCNNCYFWQPADVTENGDTLGTCRINPPLFGNEYSLAAWPHTLGTDWCGAYRRGVPPRPADSEQ
ncbi:hypothetical protein EBZ39_01345 [bacterium]|nr:hypothetical protein [bacterium]